MFPCHHSSSIIIKLAYFWVNSTAIEFLILKVGIHVIDLNTIKLKLLTKTSGKIALWIKSLVRDKCEDQSSNPQNPQKN